MKIHRKDYSYFTFYCPGCKRGHTVSSDWGYNDNPEKPTFSAHSIGIGNTTDTDYCHSYITDGMIRFEKDSKHELSGQTVELPDFPENYSVS